MEQHQPSPNNPVSLQPSKELVRKLIHKIKQLKQDKILLVKRIQDLLNIINKHKIHTSKLKDRMRIHPISGLPNHLQMDDDLSLFFTENKSGTIPQGAIFLIRLDQNFDAIQRTLKPNMFEWVLYQISQRITGILQHRKVYHTRDSEFLIHLKGNYEQEELIRLTKYIQKEISQPHIFTGYNVHIYSTIGISMYPSQGVGKSFLLQNTDIALEWAISTGKPFGLYSPQMREQVVQKMDLQNSIIKGLEQQSILEIEKQFAAFYQPIVRIEIENEKIFIKEHFAEALLRWHHPRLGLINPEQFISLAEETGLIVPLGNWMLYHVAQVLHDWNKSGIVCSGLSVNISPRQFRTEGVLENIERILQTYTIKPNQLHLEITESTLIEEPHRLIGLMNNLHKKGISFSIDDFGTGYSSLSYVHQLPVKHLKIDKSFIQNIHKDDKSRAIVKAIIAMADELGFQIIAEGIETKEQLYFLYQEGVRYIQGFLISKPMPEKDYIKYLETTCVF